MKFIINIIRLVYKSVTYSSKKYYKCNQFIIASYIYMLLFWTDILIKKTSKSSDLDSQLNSNLFKEKNVFQYIVRYYW